MAGEEQQKLLRAKKLVLVVDLDQTLIHTSMDYRIQPGIKDVYGFDMVESNGRRVLYHVRLRPYTREFLRSVQDRFEMHVFTMGSRRYAESIAELLEREVDDGSGRSLFSRRILSRDELIDHRSKSPNLRALFAANDSMVVIIDDRIDVWENQANVVQVQAYRFWKDVGDINLPPGSHDQPPAQLPKPSQQQQHPPAQQQAPLSAQQQADGQETALADTTPAQVMSANNPETVDSANPDGQGAESAAVEASSVCEQALPGVDDTVGADHSKHPVSSSSGASGSSSSSSDSSSSESGDDSPVKSSQANSVPKVDSESEISDKQGRSGDDSDDSLSSAFGKAEEQAPQQEETKPMDIEPEPLQDVKAPVGTQMMTDNDDYLQHLTSILCRVHDNFFRAREESANAMPTTRHLVPALRAETLRGAHIVFSGVIPTGYPRPESHEAWRTAVALGAVVQDSLNDSATHLVAAKYGTHKVHSAQRMKHVSVVNTQWLWCCARQWSHAKEEEFPLRVEHTGTDFPRSAHLHRPRRDVQKVHHHHHHHQHASTAAARPHNPQAVEQQRSAPSEHEPSAQRRESLEAVAGAPVQRQLSISAEERHALLQEVDAELTSDSDDTDDDDSDLKSEASDDIVQLSVVPAVLMKSHSTSSSSLSVKSQKRSHVSSSESSQPDDDDEDDNDGDGSMQNSESDSTDDSDDDNDSDDDEMVCLLDQEITRDI
ncbi:RNA polymerase II subunit A C-terminal domain phosphatase-like isoform X2 [Sycon ciliatum]